MRAFIFAERLAVIEDKNWIVVQEELVSSICKKVSELEASMNFKAKPLTEARKELLDTKFHNSRRLRKWLE